MHLDSPSCTVVVVSFNTRELTCQAIRSLLAETKRYSVHLIVVDNNSHDGSADAIEQLFPNVELIRKRENIGFAAANNLAASRIETEFILLLNPDTVVLDGATDKLIDFARSTPRYGIWGGETVFADGSRNPTFCWSRQTIHSLIMQAIGLNSMFRRSQFFNPEAPGYWRTEQTFSVDVVSGCFFLTTVKLWQNLGGFRSEYFMYGEDSDFCLRAIRLFGASPAITKKARIVHHGGASESNAASKYVKLIRAKKMLINDHFFCSLRQIAKFLLTCWPLSRMLCYRLLVKITGGAAGRKERSELWTIVWQRRAEWQ